MGVTPDDMQNSFPCRNAVSVPSQPISNTREESYVPEPINEQLVCQEQMVYSQSNQTHCFTTPSVTATGALTNTVSPTHGFTTPPKSPIMMTTELTPIPEVVTPQNNITLISAQQQLEKAQDLSFVTQNFLPQTFVETSQNCHSRPTFGQGTYPIQNTVMLQNPESTSARTLESDLPPKKRRRHLTPEFINSVPQQQQQQKQQPSIIQLIVVNNISGNQLPNESQKLCAIAPAPNGSPSSTPPRSPDTRFTSATTRRRTFCCHFQGCDKTYYKSSHLKAHIRIHTG